MFSDDLERKYLYRGWEGQKSLRKTQSNKYARFLKPSGSKQREHKSSTVVEVLILEVTCVTSYLEDIAVGMRIETLPEEVQWLVYRN